MRTSIALVIATLVALIIWPALAVAASPAAIPLAGLAGLAAGWLALRRLPAGIARPPRTCTVLWALLVLLAVVQTVRLGAYIADPTSDWWLTTRNEFWSRHLCMNAYFQAADLVRQGDANVYDAAHYPGIDPGAEPRVTVANLSPEDPYVYPPQFLLLPRAVLAMSNDLHVIRPVWYAAQVLLFLAVAALLARRFGGPGGRMSLWLLPLLWISVPVMLNFQYGQFHLTAVVLAVAAFLAFDRRRDLAGGGLLAAAILAKGFAGLVLIPLLLRRRWQAVAWTVGWAGALSLLALAVLGPEPFAAFVTYHLPRLQSGAAFAFHEAWPDLAAPLLAGNVSVYAMVLKLDALGVPGMTETFARVLHGLFTLAVLGAAVLTARARGPRARAAAWLAVLNLAAMTSPAAWGDYVPASTLWLVPLLAGGTFDIRRSVLVAVGGLCFLLPGVVPLGNWPGPAVAHLLSIATTVVLAGFNFRVALAGQPLPVRVASWRREPVAA